MRSTARSLLWLGCAALITPFAWSLAASAVLIASAPAAERTLLGFLGGAVLGSAWGAVVVVPLAVPYAAVLLAWPSLVRFLPGVERSRWGLMVAAVLMALPAALYIGVETGRFAETIRPREFWIAFGNALFGGSLGLWAPRILSKRLSPGQFLSAPTRAAV